MSLWRTEWVGYMKDKLTVYAQAILELQKISKAHSTTDEVQSSSGNQAGTANPSETLNPNKRLETNAV